jgi:3-oxoacyl-(acyl-carrier-protein) synthase
MGHKSIETTRGYTHATEVGYGATADAYHMTAPDETQSGVFRVMRRAIQDAGISPDKIGCSPSNVLA